ncbi:HlyD family efflux transporter periplasmic adaptor subunit [Phyllobacterium sp. 22552]|uniref:HlyD family efflux transporter periplasmic adaptor subunit n=1 Tax=Phyllobacterium sp. 22552 TaxID=3453941 RepID=UPI003F84B147
MASIVLQPSLMGMFPKFAGIDPIQSSAVTTSEQDESQIAPDVVALGRLVPEGGTLAVALPSGASDARIARLLVAEGERVDAGQVVAELDNLPQLLAAKKSAESTLAAQEAALEQVRASTVASLAEARAARASAEAALVLAKQELARLTKLAENQVTTQALLQHAQSTVLKANAELNRTIALVERFSGAETGRQSDIMLAKRNVDLARANLDRANKDLASGKVMAPQAGTVLEIHARVGERPSATGVITLGDVERMTAELEVYQTDIRAVALDQTVSMTAQALRSPLTGRVTRIGQIVGRQSVMSTEPAANADARVVIVTVALDAPSSVHARAYTNLEVVGRIRTEAE